MVVEYDDPSGPMLVFKTSGNMRRNLLNQVLADAELLGAESIISDLALNIHLSSFYEEVPFPEHNLQGLRGVRVNIT